MDSPELKQQLDSLKQATENLRKTKVGSKTVEDVAADLGKSAEQAKERMDKYSSKKGEESEEKMGKTAEKMAENASKASEAYAKAQEAAKKEYTKAQEAINKESEKLEAENESFRTAKQKVQETAAEAEKMKKKVLGDNFFTSFKTELVATAKELFSSDVETREINRRMPREQSTYKRKGKKEEEGDSDADAANNAGEAGSAVMVVEQPLTTWEKIAEQLQDTPIIQGILGQAKKAAKSDVGKKAKEAQNKINDTADEAREFWETSQNPWVYRVSNIYDGLFGETEMSTAVRELRTADPEFNVHLWQEVIQQKCLPEILEAYLRGDGQALGVWCSERMVRTVETIAEQRKAAGLSADPNVLEIESTELVGAQVGDGGPPILLLQGVAQQVHCLRNKKGEIVEGGEDNIEQAYYYFAFQRNLVEDELKWECVEFAPILTQTYY